MSSAVRLAAMMPASRAVCSGSPFLIAPALIWRIASRDMVIRPPARASRAVTSLPLTSTMRTVPVASTCDSVCRGLLGIGISLSKKERQALQRHGEVHALDLHVGRHLQRARRKVQHRLDAGVD